MYLVREQNNDLLLLVTDEKPFKHNGSWKTKHNCEAVMLDKSSHPDVKWIDAEPTECEIVAKGGSRKAETPKYDQYVIKQGTRIECPNQKEQLIGGYFCRNCERNMQTCNDEDTGNLIVKCKKESE